MMQELLSSVDMKTIGLFLGGGGLVGIIALVLTQLGQRAERRLKLYPQRKAVYDALLVLFSAILQRADVTGAELGAFFRDTDQAKFLFPKKIDTYLKEVYRRAVDLMHTNEQYRAFTQGQTGPSYNHEKNLEVMHAAGRWLIAQVEEKIAEKKFRKHLVQG